MLPGFGYASIARTRPLSGRRERRTRAEDLAVGGLNQDRHALARLRRLDRDALGRSVPASERGQRLDAVRVLERAPRILAGTDAGDALADETRQQHPAAALPLAQRNRALIGGKGHRAKRLRPGRRQGCPDRRAIGSHHLAAAIDDHLRRVDLPAAELPRIDPLPVGRGLARERILPAEVVPVTDVKAERQDVALSRQLAQQRVGRRAGRAALRGEELDHDRPRIGVGGRSPAQRGESQAREGKQRTHERFPSRRSRRGIRPVIAEVTGAPID